MNIIKTENHNGYQYDVYENGTTVARGEIQDVKADRNPKNQQKAGGESRQPDDHGGHLVPASQNGTSDSINLFAQNSKVNTKDVRAVERSETKAVRNGAAIETERIAYCYNDSNRPEAFMINDRVTMSDGTVYNVSSSFTNCDMSQYEQDMGDTGLENAENSYDAAKNSGISEQEFNDILEEYDSMNISEYDDTLRSNSDTIEQNNVSGSDMSDFGVTNGGQSSLTSSDEEENSFSNDNSNDNLMSI